MPTRTSPVRARSAATLLAVVLLVTAVAGCMPAEERTSLTRTNQLRSSVGVPALQESDALTRKAEDWANHMASTGRLAHRGTWSGLGSWCAAGENVGYGKDSVTVHNALMRSAPHRANILGRYDRIGTGYAKRNGRVWITQIFLRSC